jgi:hypothetical protein
MAMTRVLAALLCVTAAPATVVAQVGGIASEVSVTAGASSDEVTAGAMQARVFGDVRGVRIFGEGAWASVAGPASDAFGAAYPYERRLQVMEAYAERTLSARRVIVGVRGGRFRTPFGIYGASDHAYGGFLRAPLIRYAGYWALSNTFLEHGLNVVAGTPSLQAEYTVGAPADPGTAQRRGGVDQVLRVQGYGGALIVGASHIRTQPYQPARYAHGRAVFSGVDARWMHGGVQLRGEWIQGQPFDGMRTRGGYLDVLLHRREMGPVTAVSRVEVLDYDAGARSVLARRTTVGARVQIAGGLFAQVNASHQSGALYAARATAADAALTYTIRYPR